MKDSFMKLTYFHSFFISFSLALVSVFLPLYFYINNINLESIGIIFAVSIFVRQLVKLLSGYYSLKINKKYILNLAFLLFIICNIILIYTIKLEILYFRSTLYGIAAGILWPTLLSIHWLNTPSNKLSYYNAKRSFFRYTGLILAPAIGGLIVYFYDFNLLFKISTYLLGFNFIINNKYDFSNKSIHKKTTFIKEYREIFRTQGFKLLSLLNSIRAIYEVLFMTFILIVLKNIGLTFTQITLFITLSYVFVLPFQSKIGYMSDKFHSKYLLIPGFLISGLSLIIFSQSDTLTLLFLSTVGILVSSLMLARPMYVRLSEITKNKVSEGIALLDTISYSSSAILLVVFSNLSKYVDLKLIIQDIGIFVTIVGIILIMFHRKLFWKTKNYKKRKDAYTIINSFDKLIDKYPNIASGFKYR